MRLTYEISRVAVNQLKGAENVKELKKGDEIYVALQEGPNGLYGLSNAQFQKPKEGLYLAGRVHSPLQSLQPGYPIWISYGIEAYFVEQGAGRDIEKRRGRAWGVQVPLEMAVAVGGNGKATIKGYRWSPLGIGLRILRGPPRDSGNTEAPQSATVRLTLVNASDKPLAIVDLPEDCSFSLEPVPWAKQQWTPAHNPCGPRLATDSDIVILAPQQEKSVDLDFSDDRWLVQADGNVSQIGTLDWSEQFRIVYRPPQEQDCHHPGQRELIWHGYLPSRVFHCRGQID